MFNAKSYTASARKRGLECMVVIGALPLLRAVWCGAMSRSMHEASHE